MQFPETVDDPSQPDEERARRRLKYLLDRASLRLTGRESVRSLAKALNMNHSSVIYALRQGKCAAHMAVTIEEMCGRTHTRNEWLRRPLDVPTE